MRAEGKGFAALTSREPLLESAVFLQKCTMVCESCFLVFAERAESQAATQPARDRSLVTRRPPLVIGGSRAGGNTSLVATGHGAAAPRRLTPKAAKVRGSESEESSRTGEFLRLDSGPPSSHHPLQHLISSEEHQRRTLHPRPKPSPYAAPATSSPQQRNRARTSAPPDQHEHSEFLMNTLAGINAQVSSL